MFFRLIINTIQQAVLKDTGCRIRPAGHQLPIPDLHTHISSTDMQSDLLQKHKIRSSADTHTQSDHLQTQTHTHTDHQQTQSQIIYRHTVRSSTDTHRQVIYRHTQIIDRHIIRSSTHTQTIKRQSQIIYRHTQIIYRHRQLDHLQTHHNTNQLQTHTVRSSTNRYSQIIYIHIQSDHIQTQKQIIYRRTIRSFKDTVR